MGLHNNLRISRNTDICKLIEEKDMEDHTEIMEIKMN